MIYIPEFESRSRIRTIRPLYLLIQFCIDDSLQSLNGRRGSDQEFEVMLRQIKSIKASTGERFVVVVTD